MKVHIVSYNLDQKKISKSKIHTLPNYEQTDLKTAIVPGRTMVNYTPETFVDQDPPCRTYKYYTTDIRVQQFLSLKLSRNLDLLFDAKDFYIAHKV